MPALTAETRRLINLGQPGAELWRSQDRKTRTHRLWAVIRDARAAEGRLGAHAWGERLTELRRQRDEAKDQPAQYAQLTREITATENRVSELVPFCNGAVLKVWRTKEANLAARDDLRDLAGAIDGELGRILAAQCDFSRANGFGELDLASLAEITPIHLALSEFRDRHVLPLLGAAQGACDTRHDGFCAEEACWPVLGIGWRAAVVPPTLIGRIVNSLTGSAPAPAPVLPAPAAT